MRVAIVSMSRHQIGGIEEYLARLVPMLQAKGHDIAFLHEEEPVANLSLIPLPENISIWNLARLGMEGALGALRAWRPDVIYCNGVSDVALARALPRLSAAVFSVHGYLGTCVSSTKSYRIPVARPCDRMFGAGCLVRYYPRRCGGLNPLTMLRSFRAQPPHLDAMRDYDAVVVHSDHMRREYEKHEIRAERVYLPVENVPEGRATAPWSPQQPRRLLFLGRMTKLKGVDLLLASVARAQSSLGVGIELTLAGDGPERPALEAEARSLALSNPKIRCDFVGWVEQPVRLELLRASDLLLVPSTWPEPFGMVGLEAAAQGVPAVAFAVGGIPEWLHDGVNGLLAPGDPPTASGFAKAIIGGLEDESRHQSLCDGARASYERFAAADAAAELLDIFVRAREHRALSRPTFG